MKHFIKQEVPAKTIKIQEKISCDICGKENRSENWARGAYNSEEIEIAVIIKRKVSTVFPECGSGTTYEVDMCPECFKNKLVPWLESQGCKVNVTEWDW